MSGDSIRWGFSRRGFVLSMGAAAAGSFVPRAFAADSALVLKDLGTLKTLMEADHDA